MGRGALIDLVLTIACWMAAATLIALRLTDVIDWAWQWITAPVWAPIVVIVGGYAAVALFGRLRRIKS